MKEQTIYFNRYIAYENGQIKSIKTGKILRPGRNSKGYYTVNLYDGSSPKKPKSFLVHRLVAEAFFGHSELQINHKDGDKSNNSLENLEYVTYAENILHAVVSFGTHCGEKSHRCKISNQDIKTIKEAAMTASQAAKYLKCSYGHARRIILGEARNTGY